MGYCLLTDITNVISQRELVNLTNDTPSINSEVDTSRFEAVSKDTDSLINGYLRARYKLPLKSVPNFIKQIATDICAYRLYLRRPQNIPDHIKDNYENAIKRLLDIQKGNLLLESIAEDESLNIPQISSGFRTNKTKKDRMFSDRVMRAFRGL